MLKFSTKEYYAFGIYLLLAGATVYLPVDDINIYTSNSAKNAPDGIYTGNPAMHTTSDFTVPAVISFGNKDHKVAVSFANSDAGATGYTYNEGTGEFSITTTGSYASKTFGNITGTYDKVNDRLISVSISGTVRSYVTNNGSITLSRPSSNTYLDCENDRITLTNKIVRRYKSGSTWYNDPGNVDRAAADPTYHISGSNGLSPRPYKDGAITIRLAQNIGSTSANNIGFWIYNPSSTDVEMHMYANKTTNVDSFDDSDAYCFIMNKKFSQGWTFYCVGFRHSSNFPEGQTLYNITLLIFATATRVTFDDIVVFG